MERSTKGAARAGEEQAEERRSRRRVRLFKTLKSIKGSCSSLTMSVIDLIFLRLRISHLEFLLVFLLTLDLSLLVLKVQDCSSLWMIE